MIYEEGNEVAEIYFFIKSELGIAINQMPEKMMETVAKDVPTQPLKLGKVVFGDGETLVPSFLALL